MEEEKKQKQKKRSILSNLIFCFAPAMKKTPVYLVHIGIQAVTYVCLLYTSPSPRDGATSRMPSSA